MNNDTQETTMEKKFYSRAVASYSNKGMMKSARLNFVSEQERAFGRGGATKAESSSSLKVRKVEVINGKKFKVIS